VAAGDERLVTFESGGQPRHGILHVPAEATGKALVFCHPFAEEKKCAHRTIVEAARACADAGWAVLNFDQRGCGDSPGSFGAHDLADWREDIYAAIDCLAEKTSARVGLLGLRLGGALAAQVAEQREDVAWLALWEPVIDGARYIKQNLRRSMIKAMMTRHEGGEDSEGAASDAHALGEGTVDFDGYLVPEVMREQMEQIDLLNPPPSFTNPTFVLNIGASDSVSERMQKLADAYPAGTAMAVRQEPIWQRIGVIEARPTISATVDWLRQQ
jgi:exosortase A-associated hydrolase 2